MIILGKELQKDDGRNKRTERNRTNYEEIGQKEENYNKVRTSIPNDVERKLSGLSTPAILV